MPSQPPWPSSFVITSSEMNSPIGWQPVVRVLQPYFFKEIKKRETKEETPWQTLLFQFKSAGSKIIGVTYF